MDNTRYLKRLILFLRYAWSDMLLMKLSCSEKIQAEALPVSQQRPSVPLLIPGAHDGTGQDTVLSPKIADNEPRALRPLPEQPDFRRIRLACPDAVRIIWLWFKITLSAGRSHPLATAS